MSDLEISRVTDEDESAAAELTAAVRRLLRSSTAINAPEADLRRLARGVDALAEEMALLPRLDVNHTPVDQLNSSYSAVGGKLNPLLPFLHLQPDEIDTLKLHGQIQVPFNYKGPPGALHGGIVAALHDQVLGSVNRLSGYPAVTGWLKVDYHLPTPYDQPLDLCAWIERIEGRKVTARSTCKQNG